MSVSCFYCSYVAKDYTDLAMHIGGSKKGHRKGKRWAAKYNLINKLSMRNKRKQVERVPLTDEEKVARTSNKIELCGENTTIDTYCPKCKTTSRQSIPVEYAESPTAWRTPKGKLVMACARCQSINTHRREYNHYGTSI